ncbi:MAG: family 43 glycosylhydrolase [Clostridia bacterium]|nr:family 43 glycosylhydrolase [Clostridia bacterium]
MLKRSEIRIRDPFILTDKENGCYYMYGTTSIKEGTIAALNTFAVYKSKDLENFEEPKVIVDGEKYDGFFGKKDFWAPEVHKINGKYYLFGSVKADNVCRATHIFVCDTPDGEFVPVSNKHITPENWECLDGTFWQENGKPYMVFSHEWLQVKDGEICAMELSEDLSHAVGEPKVLFKASDNPCVNEIGEKGSGNYVTDGPFLFKEEGKLKMIWSSFYNGKYCVLEAQSDSLFGEWTHCGSKFDFDGGHAMLFYTLEGERMISLHRPNTNNLERASFFKY